MTDIGQFPHCDQRVLHGPGDGCEFCNAKPEWQQLRVAWGIAFSGHVPAKMGDRCGKRITASYDKGKICMQAAGHGSDVPCSTSEPWESLPCPADAAVSFGDRGDYNGWPGNTPGGYSDWPQTGNA